MTLTRPQSAVLGMACGVALLAGLSVIPALASSSSAATTITVAADGSGNYRTIQSALAAAPSGAVISIKKGTCSATRTRC